MNKIAFGVVALAAVACLVATACDPTAQEMVVRMRVQQFINLYPSIYQDIVAGRMVPNRNNYPTNQQQQGNYVQPGTYVQPNQQGTYVQPGTFVQPNQQGQQVVPQVG